MIDLATAINSLSPSAEFTISENDFNKITWLSENITQPTKASVDIEVTRLQAEYDSLAYARNRKAEYDQLNQWEMHFDDQRDGTTTWVDKINEIKGRHPK